MLLSIISLIGFVYLFMKDYNKQGKENKIAFVQTKILMQKYEGVKDAQLEYDKRRKEEVGSLHAIIEKYQKSAKTFEEEKSKLPSSVVQNRLQELKLMESEIAKKQEENKKIYEDIYAETVAKVYLQITDFIVKYGKEHKFDYVLGANIVAGDILYGSEKLDITDDILNELNNSYKK